MVSPFPKSSGFGLTARQPPRPRPVTTGSARSVRPGASSCPIDCSLSRFTFRARSSQIELKPSILSVIESEPMNQFENDQGGAAYLLNGHDHSKPNFLSVREQFGFMSC